MKRRLRTPFDVWRQQRPVVFHAVFFGSAAVAGTAVGAAIGL